MTPVGVWIEGSKLCLRNAGLVWRPLLGFSGRISAEELRFCFGCWSCLQSAACLGRSSVFPQQCLVDFSSRLGYSRAEGLSGGVRLQGVGGSVQCPGLARGGGCRQRRVAVGTPNHGPRGSGRARCLLLAARSPHRGLGGMWPRRQGRWRRRNRPPCLHCCPRSACRRGCGGRSCCCARGCLLTRPAPRTRPRIRSAAGHPLAGLGGRHLGLGRRRPSLRLITSLFPCWKGRVD